jgi:hypothetical protein
MTLKHRGYNVGRILAKKQHEARLMEQERLKKVAEQRKAVEEQEKRYQEQLQQQQQQQQQQISVEDRAIMPGAFNDSPPRPIVGHAHTDSGNFLTRGFNRFQKMMQEEYPKSMQTPEPSKQLTQTSKQPIRTGNRDPQHTVTEPHRITANLHRAIQAGRDHASGNLWTPPTTFDVKEVNTFCDSTSGQDQVFVVQTPSGMRVYMHRSLPDAERREFLQKNAVAINTFSLLLLSIADVFSMSPSSLHIFYDSTGTAIAFNLGGAIFCNFSFFRQLHARQAEQKKWDSEAFKYWWVTVCHELAHNLVKEHGSQHSFYM